MTPITLIVILGICLVIVRQFQARELRTGRRGGYPGHADRPRPSSVLATATAPSAGRCSRSPSPRASAWALCGDGASASGSPPTAHLGARPPHAPHCFGPPHSPPACWPCLSPGRPAITAPPPRRSNCCSASPSLPSTPCWQAAPTCWAACSHPRSPITNPRTTKPQETTQTGECRNLASGEGQDRTGDTAIFSRVLYQLSYLAGRRSFYARQKATASGTVLPLHEGRCDHLHETTFPARRQVDSPVTFGARSTMTWPPVSRAVSSAALPWLSANASSPTESS